MRKLLFGVVFLAGFVFLKSVTAQGTYAAPPAGGAPPPAPAPEVVTISGVLDNRQGSIDLSVTVTYYDSAAGYIGQQVFGPVTKGTTLDTIFSTSGVSPFSMSWFTSCNQGSVGDIPGSGGAYDFGSVYVHCTTPNSTISITSTSCSNLTGQVNWRVNSTNPNIANFKIYKAIAPALADTDTAPATVDFVAGTTTYNQSLTGLSVGTYNVKIVATANGSNSTVSSPPGSFTCVSPVTPATNLNYSLYCTSGVSKADFNWTLATGATFSQQLVEYNTNGTSWGSGNTLAAGVTTVTLPSLTGGITYYWRVNSQDSGGTWYPSATSTFTSIGVCNAAAATNLAQNICVSGNVDSVAFSWTRATPAVSIATGPPSQEFLEYTLDASFNPSGITSTNVGGLSSTTITTTFVDGSKYYWRINTKFSDNQWKPSNVSFFFAPSSCAAPAPSPSPNSCGGTFYFTNGNVKTITPTTPGATFNTSGNLTGNVAVGFADHNLNPGSGVTITKSPTNWSGAFGGNFPMSLSASITDANLATSQTVSFWIKYGSCYIYGTLIIDVSSSIANPSALVATSNTCLNAGTATATPIVTFQWTDNSTNEDLFYIDVSTQFFTGPASAWPNSQWGFKTRTSTAAEKSAVGVTRNFAWNNTTPTTNTEGTLDGGNANVQTAVTTDDLVPLENTTYYWRVKAHNNSGSVDSAHVYRNLSADTTVASGVGVLALNCVKKYDLSATFVGGSLKYSGESVTTVPADGVATMEIDVKNGTGIYLSDAPATKLYFYYKGNGAGGEPMPSCAGTPKTTKPVDGASPSGDQEYAINPLTKGTTQRITVTFNVGSTPGSYTAKAYVVPGCTFSPDGFETSTPSTWANNITGGYGYGVGLNKFFETTGGDVGAKETISVGVNSSVLSPTSYWQSDYVIAGNSINDIGTKVQSRNRLILNHYSKNLAPSDGVYEYFRSRFRSKAIDMCTAGATCPATGAKTIPAGTYNGLYYLGGNTTLAACGFLCGGGIEGNSVIFIDGDLSFLFTRVVMDIPSSTVVFIVSGNINVASSMLEMKGVYITKKSFVTSGAAAATLVVKGAVYADGEDGGKGLDLGRYFSTVGDNALKPTESFQFEPRYLVALSALLSSPAVGWKEVGP